MPLSPPVSRALRHTRAIQVQAFAREDGLWDIDAQITDVKTRDIQLATGLRPAGQHLHDLSLRITIDLKLNIVAVEASSDAVPYPGACDTNAAAYQTLVGLNLMQGFRHEVKTRLSGVLGCTHLTEMANILPTAALQAFANDVINVREGADNDNPNATKPFQIDRCHALRSDGEMVAQYYPRWVAKAAQD